MHKSGKEGEGIKRNKFGSKCIITLGLIVMLLLSSCAPDGGRNALKRSDHEPLKVGRYQIQEFENPLPIEYLDVLVSVGRDNVTEFLAHDFTPSKEELEIYDCTLKNDGSDFSFIKLDVENDLLGESEEEIHEGFLLYGALTNNRTFLVCNTITRALINNEWRGVSDFHVLCYDKKGKLLWHSTINHDGLLEEGRFHWLMGMGATSKNGVALFFAGVSPGDGGIITVDSKGNASEFIREKEDDLLYGIDCVHTSIQGECYLDFGIELIGYDSLTGEYGQKWDKSFSVEGRYDYGITIRSEKEILSGKADGVYSRRVGEESVVKVMTYADSGLDIDSMHILDVINDRNFVASYKKLDDDYRRHFALFSYVEP